MSLPRLRMNSYIISDTHLGHDNIRKHCERPENHDFVIYDNWKKIVGPRDIILHLGDLTVWYGMKQAMWEEACKALPGRKWMIKGNHDNRSDEFYEKLGFKIISPFTAKIGIFKIHFSHYPVDEKTEDFDFNFHGHIHNNVKDAKQMEWHRNVSIEMMNYRPVEIGDVL
jgi:calcineurin-like phosphoesterase family protein